MAYLETQKYALFFCCEKCDYKCSKKSLWTQHCLTQKHIWKHLETKPTESRNMCEKCGRCYSNRSGLWKHKKKCTYNLKKDNLENFNSIVLSENLDDISSNDNINSIQKENVELKELMKKMIVGLNKDALVKEEMVGQIKEQNKIIQDMLPKIGNNNNSNNKFNINVFLNEQCKDAINMSDFIESLQIQLKDLLYTKNNGLLNGISSVLLNGLKQLDTCKRPIHCTDMKRETLYIKDNDIWNRDNCKEKIHTAIHEIAYKQRKSIQEWEKNNPNWDKSDKGKEEYINLVRAVMADINDNNNSENKIIKSIVKETIIDK